MSHVLGELCAPAELRSAVRNYQRPDLLDRSPLARGRTPWERVDGLRGAIDEAIQVAFGETESERRLRETLVRAYIEPTSSHDRAALDLHVSRTTYFRWLRSAVARTSHYLEHTLDSDDVDLEVEADAA